jgi:hypothetical protein
MSVALIVRRVVALLCFAGALALTVQSIGDLNRVKVLKTDLAEIENVRYGLLDPEQWVARVSVILERRIEAFELTDANRPRIKRAVEQVLNTLLVQLEDNLRRRNLQASGSWMDQLKGVLQQGLQDLVVDFDSLRRKVPQYAEAVLEELSKPEAKREVRAQLISFLHQAADSTFSKTDRSALDVLHARYGCANPEDCTRTIGTRIESAQAPIAGRLGGLFVLIGALFALCLAKPGRAVDGSGVSGADARRGFDPFKLFLLTGAILMLLAGGILTPMIEIEARIEQLGLELLGEPVVFTDQVLYFQSKSVFDVVAILVRTNKPDMLLVGALIVLFSVIFPSLKVVATYIYYYDFKGWRQARLARFFALESGKWSMADVLAIAIFMAYIGFSGLIGSQLGTLKRAAPHVQVLTADGTVLAPGFFLFLAFVLASMLLSAVLEKRIGEGRST